MKKLTYAIMALAVVMAVRALKQKDAPDAEVDDMLSKLEEDMYLDWVYGEQGGCCIL